MLIQDMRNWCTTYISSNTDKCTGVLDHTDPPFQLIEVKY